MSPFSANNFRLPRNGKASAVRGRMARRTGVVLSVLLVAGLLPSAAWAAPPGDRGIELPGLQKEMKAKLDKVAAAKLEGWDGAPVQPPAGYEPSKVAPPAAGSADVALNPGSGGQLVQAGTLPVSIGKASPTESNPTPAEPSGTWGVSVEARPATEAAAVDGAIIKVTPPATGSTPVDVQLDYKKFEDLFGTEWSSRLELKQLPECFLRTPDVPECTTAKDVPSTNDPSTGTVRATVDPATAPGQGMRTMAVGGGGPMVLAASDSGSGAGGTYKATSLAASGSWSAGGSGGGFSWSYPLTAPAPPAGPAPKISFTYSSQAVDGKTSVANGQASWVGDGWDYNPGAIERRYRPCVDDLKATSAKPNNDNSTDKKKGDLCWAGDNVVMSLGGTTTELVHDATTGQWIPQSDDGSKVEHKSDAAVANGAKDGEYWIVTTRDGTRYFFGRHDVDGAGSRSVTNSVLTTPVFGNHPGEPCYQAAYADSSCIQAWRWNLDYVEDVHGNAMIIDWAKETNSYAKNQKTKERVTYDRGGYPTQITYGLRSDNLAGAPAGKVEFTVAERCIKEGKTTCSDAEFESKNYEEKQPWWDTPATLYCKADAKDCYTSSPTFWSRKRLTSVATFGQRTEGSTALSLVDRWNLTQSFPKQRTDTHPPLWLESITRTGYGVGKDENGNQQSTTLPQVSFLANVKDMPNRVATSATDATPDFDRLRVETIRTETGGEIRADYSAPCPVGGTHPKPEENTTRCFPVHWSPDPELETPPLQWFNKYVVDRVTEKDRVARQDEVITNYTYEGDAAWAKETDEFSKPELRTFSQWRGYASVIAKKGVTANTGAADATEESQTRTRYFRGMSADAGRPKVTVKDSTNTEELGEDLLAYQGQAAETITYGKAGGNVVARVLTWKTSQKTASRPREGTTALEAFRVATPRTDNIETISGGVTRTVRKKTTFDATYGLALTLQTEVLTPNGTGGWTASDQQCATTTYVHNPAKYLIGLTQRVRTTAGDCSQSGTGAVVSDARTSYDALNAFGTTPVRGLVYQIDTNDAGGTGWSTTARMDYDVLGRTTKVYDALGRATSTAFSPTNGPAFRTTAINAAGHVTVAQFDPGRGSALETTDANGRKVTRSYDNLGRTTAVWTPSQNPGKDKAAYTFAYQIAEHEPPVVTSSTLEDNGTYTNSVVIYDGLLRPRQSQAEALGGGRLITDTFYSADGTVRQTNNGYYAEGDPDKHIFVPESVFKVPNSTKTAYDGLGRAVRSTTLFADVPQYSTTVRYEGDWTLARTGMSVDGLTPLKGSRATKTATDALGRTALVQYATSTDLTTWNTTSYSYDTRNKLAKVTDPAGNNWSYTYDARGRMTASNDPDMGSSEFGYNNLDQQIWAKDSAGRAQYTTYDVLGRKTETRDDAADGPLVASWSFDSLPGAKGQPVTSTRYYDGKPFTSEVTGYDTEYRPTGSKITIPDVPAAKGLSGTYAYGTTYTSTGKIQSTTLPATPGGLAAEKLITRYNGDGQPITMSGLSWYTADTVYSPFGQVLRSASGSAPQRVWTTNNYNANTGRITNSITDRETANPNRISDVSYQYDPAGNITSITDSQPGARTDRQCYAYDPMGQLTQAWTAKTETCTGPSLNDVTPGPDGDGFWQSYSFDAIGNRTKLVDHDLANGALDDEYNYTYGVTVTGNGTQPTTTTQPHALAKVDSLTRKPGSTINAQSTYGYDTSGNTTRRTIGGDTQTLDWDRRNKVTTATSPGIGAVAVTGLSGKCLDVDNANTADNTPLQIWYCNETRAQQWRLTGDTVQALGKCLTNNAGNIVLATCDGSDKQKFVYRAADKSLQNPVTGQCVDVPNNNETAGTDLKLWACNGGANQQWSFNSTTTYLYDASGNRLIEDNGSSRTLYLGESEITVNKNGDAVDAVRYYPGPGATTVRRTKAKDTGHLLSVQLPDHHGTATTSIDQSTGQTVTRRKSDPYGNPRGAQPANWPGSRTFLGTGNDDNTTGLTHIGAREYDPTTGRFASVDPLIDITNPLQMNGYTYANGNPVGNSDPSGLHLIEGMNDGGGWFDSGGNNGGGGTKTLQNRDDARSRGDGGLNSLEQIRNTWHPPRSRGRASSSYAGSGSSSGGCTYPASQCSTGGRQEPQTYYLAGASNSDTNYASMNGKCSGWTCAVVYGVAFAALAAVLAPVALALATELGPTCLVAPAACGEFVADLMTGGASGGSLIAGGGIGAGVLLSKEEQVGSRFVKSAPCSFSPDTPVLMADGGTKPIGEIEVGDRVESANPETGDHQGTRRVDATMVHYDEDLVDLEVQGETGELGTVHTTFNHPFWDDTSKTWIPAGQLIPGHALVTDEGRPAVIVAIAALATAADMYNLTIADLHTYYVIAGATPVLVHNADGSGMIGANGTQITSSTVWRGPNGMRIDVENPNPGGRPGQMHLQVQVNGMKSSDAPKYQYNFDTGQFDGLPKNLQKELAKTDMAKGVKKGLSFLGQVC
ncbi:ricin-type beta-trefoil lectin domain protein [Streptomyces sp. NPDC098789]|uniref:ricin-type beta-trefoil lectin domain protein n=1 Tax=Streptomyces sp. NPDC098789 TaxID=3366098 RepID=UPI00382FB16A